MANYLKITDLVRFEFVSPDLVTIKDNIDMNRPGSADKTGLIIKAAATHAGIITRNNGFYLPDKMKKGASTFTDDYQKPVLTHHLAEKDAIGRIFAAEYIDESHLVKDRFRGLTIKNSIGKELGTINDALIEDFSKGKMPYAMQVDVVRNIFDSNILDDASYGGLGYIKISANITDKEAIQKFLDGRYLTGSVGATTDKAVCSTCKQDWTQDGRCEHLPGSRYDGKRCFIIAGDLTYSEWSPVNKPADKGSKVLELVYNGIHDSIEPASDFTGRTYNVVLEFKDSVTEDRMADNKEQTIVNTESVTVETPQVTDSAAEIKAPVTEETFDAFVERTLFGSNELSDADEEKLYDMMLKEMADASLSEKEITDATLSAEKRKGLAKSTFCGPGRSFPVTDCAHVTAARRLIGRYKGPGDKDAILACVSRKAKAMGCGTSKSDSVQDNLTASRMLHSLLSVFEEKHYAEMSADKDKNYPTLDEADMTALKGVMLKLVKMVGQDSVAMVITQDKEFKNTMRKVSDVALLDEIVTLETALGNVRDELKASNEQFEAMKVEYQNLTKDVEVLQDSLVKEKVSTRAAKQSHLGLLLTLQKKTVEDNTQYLTSLTDQVMDTELEKLGKEVDTKKITDKLNDGIANIPTETVNSPVVTQPDTHKQEISDSDAASMWLNLEKRAGRKAADKYLESYRAQKALPKK